MLRISTRNHSHDIYVEIRRRHLYLTFQSGAISVRQLLKHLVPGNHSMQLLRPPCVQSEDDLTTECNHVDDGMWLVEVLAPGRRLLAGFHITDSGHVEHTYKVHVDEPATWTVGLGALTVCGVDIVVENGTLRVGSTLCGAVRDLSDLHICSHGGGIFLRDIITKRQLAQI